MDPDPVVGVTKSGTPLTESMIAEEVRKAEAGYDLSTWRRVGRPSLTGGAVHSPRVSFRVPADLAQRAGERAEQEGKTLSALARDALTRYIESGPSPDDPSLAPGARPH